MTGMEDPPLDIRVTPDAHTMITRIDPDSARSQSHPHNHRYRGSSCQDPHRSHSRSFHRPSHHSFTHVTGAPAPTATATTCLTTDPHLIGILPGMTADLDINPRKQHYRPAQGSSSTL